MKKIRAAVLLLVFVVLAAMPVQASDDVSSVYIWDTAGLMSDGERDALQEKAAAIAEAYQCGCYVVTVDDFQTYGSDSPYEAAKYIYKDMDFGYGDTKDGEMLMLSMADRDFALIAYGDTANTAFTDYAKEQLDEAYLGYFGRNDWYGGFEAYLDYSETCLKMAAEGTPIDVTNDPEESSGGGLMKWILSLIIGLIAGGSVAGGYYRSMKTASEAVNANIYTVGGSLRLTRQSDRFVNRTVSRRHIQRDNRGSGGGHGGTTVDSGGFSGHSGKF